MGKTSVGLTVFISTSSSSSYKLKFVIELWLAADGCRSSLDIALVIMVAFVVFIVPVLMLIVSSIVIESVCINTTTTNAPHPQLRSLDVKW